MLNHHSKRVAMHTGKWMPKFKADKDKIPTTLARVPVFMLPNKELITIPEDAEIREGFLLYLSEKPHKERRFVGLVSLSSPDERILQRSATNFVKYRSFACPAGAA